ncbi:hypothetical protein BBP00_00004536 [Phytophthora kernoviae]|uniref:BSD domain-containing protein n=1 Tax=Phytophthora kernoviae TaxID=325452 RepID=A0A3F2RTA0_9STRA|nr:hypothetical protein BBP00_00004536 [Phytophthora kernoviae]
MTARMSEIGMSAMRASEIGMRHSAANLQMMVGTVANKAHGIATILTRNTSRGRKCEPKTTPTTTAEDDDSPLSQIEDLSEPEETPEYEPVPVKQQKLGQTKEKELPLLLPWEVRGEDGEMREDPTVKEKILELAVYRRTFVEPAGGEEEYVFDYAVLKNVARELLLSNPNLREKREILVEAVPVAVISEEIFWRNFFLRCNAIRVTQGLAPYLPEVEQVSMRTGAFARFRRGLFSKKKGSSTTGSKPRRGLLGSRSSSGDSPEATPSDDLGDLELDIDGEIEKELLKRRPSRAVEKNLQPEAPSQPNDAENSNPAHDKEAEKTEVSEADRSEDPTLNAEKADARSDVAKEQTAKPSNQANDLEYTPVLV